MKKIFGLIEFGFVVVSLLLYSGGVLAIVVSGGASQGDTPQEIDTGLIRLVFSLIYVVTFFLLALRWKKIVYFASRNMLLWMLVGYTFASVFWSYDPDTTVRRLVAFVGTTMFGAYLSSRYTIKQQLKILAWTFGLAIVLSFLFAIVLPKYGLEGGVHAGLWRGIYSHKNILGVNMTLSSLVFLLTAVNSQQNKSLLWVGFAASVILILLSDAKSSLASLLIIILLYFVCQVFRLRLAIQIPLLLCLVIIGVWTNILVVTNADFLFGLLGKDPTLTGRTEIWQAVWGSIQKQYWLGYGYEAFWSNSNSEASIVYAVVNWEPPHAHNGFLELWANLGFLGVAIYLSGFCSLTVKSFIQFQQNKQWEFCWIILFSAFIILSNVAEQNLLRENNIIWVLYVATFFSMGLLQKQSSRLSGINDDVSRA